MRSLGAQAHIFVFHSTGITSPYPRLPRHKFTLVHLKTSHYSSWEAVSFRPILYLLTMIDFALMRAVMRRCVSLSAVH